MLFLRGFSQHGAWRIFYTFRFLNCVCGLSARSHAHGGPLPTLCHRSPASETDAEKAPDGVYKSNFSVNPSAPGMWQRSVMTDRCDRDRWPRSDAESSSRYVGGVRDVFSVLVWRFLKFLRSVASLLDWGITPNTTNNLSTNTPRSS